MMINCACGNGSAHHLTIKYINDRNAHTAHIRMLNKFIDSIIIILTWTIPWYHNKCALSTVNALIDLEGFVQGFGHGYEMVRTCCRAPVSAPLQPGPLERVLIISKICIIRLRLLPISILRLRLYCPHQGIFETCVGDPGLGLMDLQPSGIFETS